MEAVCLKISFSPWLLKSHCSYHVLTGIGTSVCLSVRERGPSSFLTFNLKLEEQFPANCKAVTPLIRYRGPSEILGLPFPGELSLQLFAHWSKSLATEWSDCTIRLLGKCTSALQKTLIFFFFFFFFCICDRYIKWTYFDLIFFQAFLTFSIVHL